jgi:hypothetical protein
MLNSGNSKAISRAKKIVKGFMIEWDDLNPLDERAIVSTKLSHTSPVARMWVHEFVGLRNNPIFTKIRFLWNIRITLFFEYPNGDKYEEELEMDVTCLLKEADEVCLTQIEFERKRHASDAYRFTRFNITCAG